MHRFIIVSLLIGLSLATQAQSTIEQVLQSVAENNPELLAHAKLVKAQQLGFKTGLTPENPEIEYENSFSSDEGKPYELSISQAFDFPTAYLYRHQISREKMKTLEHQVIQKRQEILLQTKLTCLEIIYLRKMNTELRKRYENAEQLYSHYQKRLKEGDATILDLNKVKMEMVNSKHRLSLYNTKLSNLQEELKRLNGNRDIELATADYTAVKLPDRYDDLSQQILPLDPIYNNLRVEKQIAQKEIALNRAEALPKWSIGYRYLNSDLTESANGLKLGVSIPLWANKNKVKQSKQHLAFSEQQLSVRQISLQSELKQLFLDFQNLKTSLQEYQTTLSSMNSTELLSKALQLGEISSIEYFLELSYYYNSYDAYLEVEHAYYQTAAKINRFQL